MAKSFVQRVAEENAQLKNQLRNVSASSRLANASLEDEPLDSFDVEGNLKATFGRQPDGSHGGLVRDSGPQPTLTAPDLTAKELGALAVVWNGKTTDGDLPLVHGHTDILYARSEDGSEPELSEYRKAPSTIRDRDGGGTTIVCSPPGTWYVRLQLVGQDRVTKGEPSEATSVEIEAKVDRQEMLDKLEEGERLIEEAREDLALSEEERAQKITELETRQTELTENLALGLDYVYDQAEARAQELADLAVVQAANAAQVEYDTLRNLAEKALATAGSNVIEDPHFETETWPTRWDGRSGYAVSRTSDDVLLLDPAARTGAVAMAFTEDGTQSGSAPMMSVRAGDIVRLSVTYRGQFSSNFQLRMVDRTNGASSVTGPAFESSEDWTSATYDYTVPSGVTDISGGIWLISHSSGVIELKSAEMRDITSAYEAVQKAEQALAAANSAHETAGDAANLAQSAYNRAGSQGSILGGTTAPAGEAPEDSYWIQWTSAGADGEPAAVWKRVDGTWVSQDIDPAFAPVIDIGFGTVGVLEVQRIIGLIAQFQTLFVGNNDNLFSDPQFARLGSGGEVPQDGSWLFGTTNHAGGWRPWQYSTIGWALRSEETWSAGGTSSSQYFHKPYGVGVAVRPGERYVLDMTTWRGSSSGLVRIWWVFWHADGSRSTHTAFDLGGGVQNYTSTFTVPNDPSIERMGWGFARDTSAVGSVQIREVNARKRISGTVIDEDGIQTSQIDTVEFFSNEGVIGKIWTDTVRSRLVQSVGIITEEMVATESVTTPKLKVTEDMVAKFAQILHLVADQVEMNNFIAGSGMVGLLEAIGLTLSDEAGGRRTEVSGAGISVIDTATGTPEIQLGTFSDDLLTLRDRETGDVSLSMSNGGSLSAVKVSSEQDLNVAGKPLMGPMFNSPQAAATTSVLDALGWGASRVLVRQFTSAISGPSMRGIAHIEAKVVPGRIYRIFCPDFQMGDRQDYYMIGNYTTSSSKSSRPATPTSNSPTLGTVPGRVPPAGYGWPTTSMSFEKIFTPTTEEWIRVLFSIGRFSGAGDLVTFNGSNSIATNPRFLIEDLGPRVGDGGVTTWRDPSSTTGFSEAPDIVTQPYPVAETATYTWNPTTGVATRQGINVEPRFGYWPNGLYYLTWVRFNNWTQGGSFYNADVSATPKRWATSAGQVLQSSLLAGATTGTPPTSFNTSIAQRLPDLTGVGAGATRMLPLNTDQAEALAGMYRGLALFGWSGWTGSSQNNAAAGVLNLDKTFARLHTTTATNDG